MKDYQQRVVEEKKELDIKKEALSKFLKTEAGLNLDEDEFNLDEDEFNRLETQLGIMHDYSNILAERIVNFK